LTPTPNYKHILKRQDGGQQRQERHGQQTVAEDTHGTRERNALRRHQVEQGIDRQTAQHANAVDVAKMHFAVE